MRLLHLVPLVALASCGLPEGPQLVSAQYPPGADNTNAEPQTLNSLPPGAANFAPGPNGTAPNFLSFKIGGR